MISIKRLVM